MPPSAAAQCFYLEIPSSAKHFAKLLIFCVVTFTAMTRSSRARDLSGTEKKSSKCATWPGARLEWDFGNSEKLTVYPSQIDVWSTWMFFERSFHFFVLYPSFTSSFSTVFGSLRSFCLKYSRKLPRQKQCVTWPEFYHFWKQGVCATWPSARLDRVIAVLLTLNQVWSHIMHKNWFQFFLWKLGV